MSRFAIGVGLCALGLLAMVVVGAARLPSRQTSGETAQVPYLEDQGAVGRLSKALTFRTTATQRSEPSKPFDALHAFLRQAYPMAHDRLGVEPIADLSLLYTWPGTEPAAAPIVLMGHMDVVEAESGSDSGWQHPPFGGRVTDGYVWGRGALDDKSSVLSTLEAIERLLSEHFMPRRTIYVALSHDEETGGAGARAILETLRERGINEFGLVLDEGGAILPASRVPGVEQPVGLVGIAEKRTLNLELVARSDAGHASAPPAVSAIGRLGQAVAKLEANPYPARLDGATAEMLEHLAPEMTFGSRLLFSNLWLFRPLVLRVMARSVDTSPVVRTTIAPTVVRAGSEANVLPDAARATLNVRLLPGDSDEDVVDHITRVVDDSRITIRPLAAPTTARGAVSSTAAPAFSLLSQTIRQTYGPGTLVAPYLAIASVDARWYAEQSPHVYRFRGARWEADATERIHGIDERIGVDAYLDSIRFMYLLIRNTNRLE